MGERQREKSIGPYIAARASLQFINPMLHILWSIIVGFIVGLIASAIMHTHLGFIGTTLLGIVGSVIGGLIARLFSRPPEGSRFHPAGFLMSIVGAIVVVFLVRMVS